MPQLMWQDKRLISLRADDLNFPADCPDLNPFDFFGGYLQVEILKCHPRTREELKVAIGKEIVTLHTDLYVI